MMQPCASAAGLRGGGPTLNHGAKAMFRDGLPPPRIVIGGPSRLRGPAPKSSRGPRRASAHAAGRRATPSGASPVVASLHNAISSFLARATIIALRVPPRASAVRARYQRAKWLSAWKRRKRQASWSMPRRPLRRAQRLQALRRAAQARLEAADAEAGQGALHPVHDPGALAHEALALAARALGVLLLQRRRRGHAAVVRLAAQPAQEGAL